MKLSRYAAMAGSILVASCATVAQDPGRPADSEAQSVRVPDATAAQAQRPAADALEEKPKSREAHLYPGTGTFINPPPAPAPLSGQPEDVSLNFEGADLREVIRVILGDVLGENYAIDPRVQGSITVRTSRPITRAAALSTLDTLLRMNGAAMVKDVEGYRIAPIAGALKGNATPRLGGNVAPGYGIQVVQLQFVSAREMAKILEPLVPDGSVIRVDEARNLLMLAGGERDLRHALETVGMFDVDWLSGMSIGFFPLRNIDVRAITPELTKVFGDGAKGPLAGVVRVIPLEKMNAVLIATPQQKYLEQAKIWIDRLDAAAKAGSDLHVYNIQNGRADKMAELLNQLYSGRGSSSGSSQASVAPGLTGTQLSSGNTNTSSSLVSSLTGQNSSTTTPLGGAMSQLGGTSQTSSTGATGFSVAGKTGTVRVIADKDNNALLILASPEDYDSIEDAIRKMDVVPRQVLIEVTIAEVTLSGDLSYGLEWYFSGANGTQGQLVTGTSTSVVGKTVPGFSYWKLDAQGNIRSVLNALASDSKLKVISSPHVMVTDNQKAQIQVGSRVPTIASTTSGTITSGVIQSVQYLDTGVMLSVIPHINVGGLVRMDVVQEVSDAVRTQTSGIDSPTITRRATQTSVIVQNGETVVLGGLIQDSLTNTSNGLPFLSEIPVVGGLFGTQTRNNARTELIALITPKVVENADQAKEITEELKSKLQGLGQLLNNKAKAKNQ